MIEISGLWEGTTKKGDTYFSGYLGKAKVLIFKNNNKKEDNHPDYIIYLDEKKDSQKSEQKQQKKTNSDPNDFGSEEFPF